MGVQLFNVLFIKVGGTRPVTGLTVQYNLKKYQNKKNQR